MKVLLINSNQLKPPITPLGLAYVAAAAMEAGHNVRLLDLNFSDNIEADIKKFITADPPDVIGISIRNIDNVTMIHSVYYIPKITEIVSCCKKASPAPVVLGGPGFSMMPMEILHHVQADFGVIGEGEKAFVQLLECINKKEIPSKIQGIIYLADGKIFANNPVNMTSSELNRLGLPARELLDNMRYLNDGGMGNIQTKRGCDQRCIYCTYPVIEGRKLRFRNPQNIVDEIETLKAMGIDYLHFSDSTFNNPNDHAFAMCREMVKRGVSIQYTPYMSPYAPSKELLSLAKQSGCDGITYGTDAVSEQMLVNLKKGFTVKDIEQSAQFCKELDIPFSLNLLFGGPGETKETVLESLNNIDRIQPIAAGAMIGIRCYPKTELWNIAVKENLITADTDILEPFYYVSPSIDKDWLLDTVTEYNRTHDNFFMPSSKKGIHTDNMVVEMFREGFRGPFWEVYKELMNRLKAQQQT